MGGGGHTNSTGQGGGLGAHKFHCAGGVGAHEFHHSVLRLQGRGGLGRVHRTRIPQSPLHRRGLGTGNGWGIKIALNPP